MIVLTEGIDVIQNSMWRSDFDKMFIDLEKHRDGIIDEILNM